MYFTSCTKTCYWTVPVHSPASKAGPPSLTCLTNMVSIGSSLFLCFPEKERISLNSISLYCITMFLLSKYFGTQSCCIQRHTEKGRVMQWKLKTKILKSSFGMKKVTLIYSSHGPKTDFPTVFFRNSKMNSKAFLKIYQGSKRNL